MISADFDYARPSSVEEALRLLATDGAVLLAGGHHLVPRLTEHEIEAKLLVDISRLAELRRIAVGPEWLVIGAGATLSAVMSVEVAITAPLLYAVLPSVASVAVRNRATIGGNIFIANASSELPVALTALDARVVVRRADGERTIPIDAFLAGPRPAAGEMLTEIRIPLTSAGRTVGAFSEIAARAGVVPLACVAASLQADAHGIVRVARIVAGGVQRVPSRARAHEAALIDQPLSESVSRLAGITESGLEPSPDLPESNYALDVLPTLIRRAVSSAVAQ
jgi:carbon-monoxide dehydrogenase medium subunit